MNLELQRVVLFVHDLGAVAAFYRDVLGLPVKPNPDDEREWLEFQAGACTIALHRVDVPAAKPARRQPKIVFRVADVPAARAALTSRGAKLGPVQTLEHFAFCDGKDPEGNAYSLSSRP